MSGRRPLVRAALVLTAPIGLAVIVATLPYLTATFYRFDAVTPFSGAHWYNPYASLDAAGGRWRQANFHAHSTAWGGVTDGHSSPHTMADRYRAMGYDIAALSNYHTITRAAPGDSSAVPVYEHGINVRKQHALVIGARRVVWRDYPLLQSVHQQQELLSRLREAGALVVLAHPALRGGRSADDVRLLADYDLFEVLNHFVTSDTLWDAALTAGRLPWLVANDDSHDADGHGETGVAWTMLYTTSTHAESTYAALRAGRAYGVRGQGGRADLALGRVDVRGDTLEIRHRGGPARVRLIGDGGQVIAERPSTGVVRIALPAWTHYARAVLSSETSALWLNPVVRWDGRALPVASASVDARRTLAYRLLVGVCLVAVFTTARQRRRARARPRIAGTVAA